MIQIRKVNLNNICNDFYENTKEYFNYDICNKKEKDYIKNNLKKIITCKPQKFHSIIAETKAKGIRSDRLKKIFVGDEKHFSGYKKFSSKNTKKYNAYTLSEHLDITVCPYCNRNYVNTVKSKSGKSMRPHFDHFVCKKKHPILAMSFYNLIPSCNVCNSSIKSVTKFYFKSHIHPYFDDFNAIKRFNINKGLLSLLTSNDDFKIIFEDREFITQEEKFKAENHISDFILEDIYNSHKDKVLELVDFSRAYNHDSFNNLVNTFANSTQIFKDPNDIKRLLLCHHVEDENIGKRPLNKLVKDISEKLKII